MYTDIYSRTETEKYVFIKLSAENPRLYRLRDENGFFFSG